MNITCKLDEITDLVAEVKGVIEADAEYVDQASTLDNCAAALRDITCELAVWEPPTEYESTDPNTEGQRYELVADFPYPHPDDRDVRRLALYHAPTGDDTGEYIIWSESREPERGNGWREPNRCWGHYHAYTCADEKDTAYYTALKMFQFKCGRIVSPFVRDDEPSA